MNRKETDKPHKTRPLSSSNADRSGGQGFDDARSPSVTLTVHAPEAPGQRPMAAVRALAIAIQANLYQLKTAAARREALRQAAAAISCRSPGAVASFREALVDHRVVKEASDDALLLRLHEVWGQYCAMCWLHEAGVREPTLNFALLPPDVALKCGPVLEIKIAEVHALLWKLRHEQRRRNDETLAADPFHSQLEGLADRIPAEAYGRRAEDLGEGELILAACEHAGMLAVLRWMRDPKTTWGDPALMFVAELPF